MNLQKELEEERKARMGLEKQLSIIKQLDTNKINTANQSVKLLIFSLLNKEEVGSSFSNPKILSEIFNNDEVNFNRFLGSRVEALEFQNFKLLSKHEKYSVLINNYIDELVEFIEVISDIKNVVNQVFESQALTKEFLIIRETLNSRDEFLEKQKKFFLAEKEKISKELVTDVKYQILLTHDKITENYLKLLETERAEGMNALIIDKIEELNNIKNNLVYYEDFLQYKEENQINQSENNNLLSNRNYPMRVREALSVENFTLKTKFLKLKSLFYKLVRNKHIELDENSYTQLSSILNDPYDAAHSEDLFNMLKAQALLVEINA